MAEIKYLDKNGLSTVWSKVKGIVTPKADKVSGATAGHLAGLNSSGNLVDSGLAADNIAQKDGSYSGMTVGAAEDLVSAESVASEFTYRVTGGSTAVGKGGTAIVDRIKGRTLVWNQLVKPMDIRVLDEGGVTKTITKEKLVLNGTATTTSFLSSIYISKVISGHVYLFTLHNNRAQSNATFQFYTSAFAGTTIYGFSSRIVTATVNNINAVINLAIYEGTSFQNEAFYPQVFDLTLMFGAGNEPSTIADFEALYPGTFYDYNPGTLISNAATAIETVGFNQWDEEWESGAYNDGVKVSDNSCIRSKNYIKVLPDTEYYYKFPKTGRISYFDDAKTFISSDTVLNNTKTTPANCYYITFHVSQTTTYANDICINLSDPSRNGTYEPHWRSELELNIPTLTGKLNGTGNSVVIFPDGLRSAGTVYDEIVGNKAIKRIGAVDLGALSWGYNSGDHPSFYTNFTTKANANGLCPIYTIIPETSIASAGNMTLQMRGNLAYVVNTSYSDAATFKAAMSGVMLYYELATPEEYILDEAIPTAMRNDPYGTERRLPEDTAAIVTAPFRADITYSTNIKEAVQSLPQNYININSMQDFLAALGTLMGGTWTMRPADGKFDFTFTPNPSNE